MPAETPPRLILASASPRRAALLEAAGIAFDVVPAAVDEIARPGETPEALVARLAAAKAAQVAARHLRRPVLGADTVVVVDGDVLGKPADAAAAARMLRRLSGRAHTVLTGVVLAWPEGEQRSAVASARVELAPLDEEEIAWHTASGEGSDKAGGYAIQGLASRFVTRVDGPCAAVVGLPVAVVHQMLRKTGLWHYSVRG